MSELRDKGVEILEDKYISNDRKLDEIIALVREQAFDEAIAAVEDLDSGRENDYHDRAIAQAIKALKQLRDK